MKIVTPRVFVIGESVAIQEGLQSMLDYLGVPEWKTDAESDTEKLSEIAGKLCYMSFDTDLNANLTRTGTRNNHDYLQQGIIATKHGSVLVWESGVTETMDNAFTCDSPGFSDEENLSNAKQQAIQWLTSGAKEEAKT